ncbi:MAG TPA: hypothetical protein QKA08_05055 [Candidatus Megaira endosymbiont of Nemacystus decipiens]|nr:hypothetical protein [Candidatus Megaera endosymbiont of Nemacystus decipiens]
MPTSVDLSNPNDNKKFGEFNDFLLSKNKFSPEEIKKEADTRNITKSNFNNLNSNDLTAKTPLHRFMKGAAGNNITKENIECLKELGADFNSLDARHQDPLSCYLSRNDVNLDIFKLLLSKKIGADIFITEGTEYKKFNHLHTYLLSKKNEISIEILRYFKKDLGADFNCATRGNFKVPHLLCIYNSKKITKEILSYFKDEAGVDFNALDGSNKNIAHYYLNSCEEPNEEIVEKLVKFGVDFTQQDRHDGMDAQDKYVKLIHGIKNVPNFITKKLGGPYHGRLYNNRNRFGKDKISYCGIKSRK